MSLVTFESDSDHLVTERYSSARGPVLRSERSEIVKALFPKGEGAEEHAHPEEQTIYVLSGKMQMTVGGETYIVEPGQASFHPSNVPHGALALEDSYVLSFKVLVDPQYEATGSLS